MIKKRLYFVGFAFMIAMLSSCHPFSDAERAELPESAGNAPLTATSPEPEDPLNAWPISTQPTPALVTEDEARAICIAWLNSRADVPSYSLIEWSDGLYPSYHIFGDQYYCFVVDGMPVSWFKILVNIETGEPLFEMGTAGDYPQTTVGLLLDWDGWEHATYQPTLLTADEANAVYNTWRENRPNTSCYTLDSQAYEHFILFGEPYILLHAEESSMYWYHVLVHEETSELLFMMTEDGQYPVTSIDLLDDWYNSMPVT